MNDGNSKLHQSLPEFELIHNHYPLSAFTTLTRPLNLDFTSNSSLAAELLGAIGAQVEIGRECPIHRIAFFSVHALTG
jgi:hypothetical protein